MKIEYGEFKIVGKHKGCKYQGSVCKRSLMKIDGRYYPPDVTPTEWYWCNGRRWVPQEKIWVTCGYKCDDPNLLDIE